MPQSGAQSLQITDRGLSLRIVQSGAFVFLICAFVSILFLAVLGLQTRTERVVLLGLWAALLLMWAGGSAMAWVKRGKEQYFLMPEAVVVSRQGFMHGQEELFRYDSILSVRVKQTMFGKRHGYGDIILSIPRLHGQVVLRDVLQPQQCAVEIKKHIGSRSTSPSSLIS